MWFFVALLCSIAVVSILFSRLNALDRRLTHTEKYLQEATKFFSKKETVSAPAHTPTPIPVSVSAQSHIPSAENAFIAWCKEDWLMKLGALLLILGVGWFLSLGIWFAIGAIGRVTAGFLLGAVLLVFGYRRIEKLVTQGSVLMVAGATTIIATMWASRELYHFFNPPVALATMFLVSCVLGATSFARRYKPLAYANVLLAGIAPLLTASPEPSFVGLFSYLLVLSVASVWFASASGWRELSLVSLMVIFLYSAPFLSTTHIPFNPDTGLLFAFIFTALFFFSSLYGMRGEKKMQILDLITAVASGVFLLAWVLSACAPEWQSLVLVAWTLVFAFGAFFAVQQGAEQTCFFAYAGVGVVLLGTATALELHGATLAIASIIEALVVLLVGYRLVGKANALPYLALPSVIPFVLSLVSMGSYAWQRSMLYGDLITTKSPLAGILHKDAVVVLLALCATLLCAFFFGRKKEQVSSEEVPVLKQAEIIAWTFAGFYMVSIVWLFSHALLAYDSGTAFSLFVYIIVALFFFVEGNKTSVVWQKYVARVLFALVMARLFLVEAWRMDIGTRVLLFTGVGVLLIVVSWYEGNKRKQQKALEKTTTV